MADQPNVPNSGPNEPVSSTPAPAPTPDPNSFDAKVANWWANNKLLFFLVLPLIIVFFLRDVIFSMLAGAARKDVKEAQDKDAQLQQESAQAAQAAAAAKATADAAAQRIDDRKDDDVPADWNTKKE